jgi:hypothetical protein
VIIGQYYQEEAVILAAMVRQNISLDPKVFEEFCEYAGKKGIKISTWVNQQMINFIEEEKMIEEFRKQKREGTLK